MLQKSDFSMGKEIGARDSEISTIVLRFDTFLPLQVS